MLCCAHTHTHTHTLSLSLSLSLCGCWVNHKQYKQQTIKKFAIPPPPNKHRCFVAVKRRTGDKPSLEMGPFGVGGACSCVVLGWLLWLRCKRAHKSHQVGLEPITPGLFSIVLCEKKKKKNKTSRATVRVCMYVYERENVRG